MDKAVRSTTGRRDAIAAYKSVLKEVLDQRPSGMRNRLAEALRKNRSFVSQITNPAYDTPIPFGHVQTIFALCHFSAQDKRRFLEAYEEAHPNSRDSEPRPKRTRAVAVEVPDLGDDALNADVDRLVRNLAAEIGRTFAKDRRRK